MPSVNNYQTFTPYANRYQYHKFSIIEPISKSQYSTSRIDRSF